MGGNAQTLVLPLYLLARAVEKLNTVVPAQHCRGPLMPTGWWLSVTGILHAWIVCSFLKEDPSHTRPSISGFLKLFEPQNLYFITLVAVIII